MKTIGVYHGDEDWVLKGIGQDLSKSLAEINRFKVKTTDRVFKSVRLDADYHVFVQQGQLNKNCRNNSDNVPKNSICLFTHLDIGNFKPEILACCKAVIFNSSVQLSMAIANGYNPSNAYLRPHAVDPRLHQILRKNDPDFQSILDKVKTNGKSLNYRSAVGFCGRYWEKHTYVRRKNYDKIKSVATNLAESGIPILIIGPGWNKLFTRRHPLITLVDAKYHKYPYLYNIMKIFVSLSVHEGGPLPILESMCCGVYPIVTNTGFAFDILRDRNDGVIVNAFRPASYYVDVIKSHYYSEHWDASALRQRASEFSFLGLAGMISDICQ